MVVGHDVGARVALQTALMRPDRFRAVIALSVPYLPRLFGTPAPPTTLMPRTEDAVFCQLYFQTPEAEQNMERDVRRTFRSQLYSLSGDRPPPAGGAFNDMVPRKGGSPLTDPATLPPWITEADVDVYVAEFTRSSFRGPLAWYRNVDRSWELLGPFAGAKVTVPALYMVGERDFNGTINRQAIAKMPTLVPKLRPVITLAGCGHWTEQERAPEVNAAMIDFLRSL